jgi:hypothetical protein
MIGWVSFEVNVVDSKTMTDLLEQLDLEEAGAAVLCLIAWVSNIYLAIILYLFNRIELDGTDGAFRKITLADTNQPGHADVSYARMG